MRTLFFIALSSAFCVAVAMALTEGTPLRRWLRLEKYPVYYQLIEMRERAHRSGVDGTEKARQIGEKIEAHYRGLSNLSFTQRITYYWYWPGKWLSWRPFDRWSRRDASEVRVASTATSLRTEAFVKQQPIYTFLIHEGVNYEYKYPSKIIKDVTEVEGGFYSIHPPTTKRHALSDWLHGFFVCGTAMNWDYWVGENLHQPNRFNTRFAQAGSWIGRVDVRGYPCDVVLTGDEDLERWDALFVDEVGFVHRWLVIDFDPPLKGLGAFMVADDYENIRTAPLPPSTFEPLTAPREAPNHWTYVPFPTTSSASPLPEK